LLGENKPLRTAIATGKLHSMVFWGPPGTGKTTLAKLLAEHSEAHFVSLSAVLSGVKDIREAVGLIKPNKMLFYHTSKAAQFYLLVPRLKTHRLS